MPLEFSCPHCGCKTNVDDRYSGQSGPCSGCGQTVTIPPIAGAAGGAPPAGTGGGAIVALLLVVVAGALLLCGGAGLVMFGRLRAVTAITPFPNATTGPPFAVATQAQCAGNLNALALAMHSYHSRFKTFPPAYIAADDGTPMHSWRVLLLPYLGHETLYSQYNFDEPWDSPSNLLLASTMPPEFRCPDDMLSGSDEASYAMIVAPGMLSDGESASSMSDIKDGTSNTLMIVEAHGSGIAWIEPRDLDGRAINFQIQAGRPGELNGHGDRIQAAFCDGAVRELSSVTPPEDMRAMATIDGGEVVFPP